MSKKKVLLRGVFINRDTNGEGVLKVGTTLIHVSTVMGILYKLMLICSRDKALFSHKEQCIFHVKKEKEMRIEFHISYRHDYHSAVIILHSLQ